MNQYDDDDDDDDKDDERSVTEDEFWRRDSTGHLFLVLWIFFCNDSFLGHQVGISREEGRVD